jgi:hypothetical protein
VLHTRPRLVPGCRPCRGPGMSCWRLALPAGGGMVASAFGDVQVARVFEGRDDGGADGGQAGGPLPLGETAGESTHWPAWSRSPSARSPRPGTTGSPRSASGSGGLARPAWPGCGPRGTRSPAGTGRRSENDRGRAGPPRPARPDLGPARDLARFDIEHVFEFVKGTLALTAAKGRASG